MPEKQRPKVSRYDLITGADTYATQTSQNPETSRLLVGWIPGDDGGLYREWNDPSTGTGLPNRSVKKIFQFDFNNGTTLVRFFYAVVTAVDSITYNLYQLNTLTNVWSQVTAVGTLANVPSVAKVQSGSLLHLSDGIRNFMFDGTTWVTEGFGIPLGQVAIDVIGGWHPSTAFSLGTIASDSNGNIQIVTVAGTSSARVPNWSVTAGTTVVDGSVTWKCLGSPKSWLPLTAYGVNDVIYNQNGDYMTVSVAGTSGAAPPLWDGRPGQTTIDGGITWLNKGKFVPIVSGRYADNEWKGGGSYALSVVIDTNLNIQSSVVGGSNGNTMPVWNAQAGGITNDNIVRWQNFGPYNSLVAWQPNTAYLFGQPLVDSNGNFQFCRIAGTSGATEPSWNGNGFVDTVDNTITWSYAGQFSALPAVATLGKYYWYTEADQTIPRVHESSSSQLSLGTGPLNHQTISIFSIPGLFSVAAGSRSVTISPSTDYPGPTMPRLGAWMIGKGIRFQTAPSFLTGIIQSVAPNGLSLTLVDPASNSFSNERAWIADPRATNIHFYQSESDGSKIGQLVIPTANVGNPALPYVDCSGFSGDPVNYLVSIFRPVRNDPAPPSLLAEVHKYRIWRRRETKQNFFSYTANEEVIAGLNGSPQESVPGADVNTLSDIVNEQPYPDASNSIRAFCSHGDALYIASERQCIPLYGQSIDDFGLSQVTAFSLGAMGRHSMISTAHGLVFVSYDKKVFLYPTSNYYWAYVPNDVNVTDNLIEIGKPIRKVLEKIQTVNPFPLAGDILDEVNLTFYFFNRRNWLILSFLDKTTGGAQTWVYDFSNKGWFRLATGYLSTAVLEITPGNKVLVGGGINGGVFVIDDLTGRYVSSGNQPNAVWRPALIDFGDPDIAHIPLYVEFEVSNVAMANDLNINYYLDPIDVDNPPTPRQILFSPVSIGSNKYRGFFKGGNLCHRLLVEFNAAASPVATNAGHIRGIKLVANPASGLVK